MSELIKRIDTKVIKVHEVKFPNNAGVVVDIFDKSEVKGKRDLIDVEAVVRFFGDFAFMGALGSPGENRKLKPRNLGLKGEGTRFMKKLKDAGVIDMSGQIHTENLPEFFKGTKAARIRDLCIENPRIKTRKIAEELNVTPGYVRLIIRKLRYAGLLEGEAEKKKEPEEIDNPTEKPSSEVVVRSRVGLPDLIEMPQKAGELDKKILALLSKTSTLYVTEIAAAFEGAVFSSDIERRVFRLALEGRLKRSKERVGGKKVTKVEKIDLRKKVRTKK